MWLEFVKLSLLAQRVVFSRSTVYPPPKKLKLIVIRFECRALKIRYCYDNRFSEITCDMNFQRWTTATNIGKGEDCK